MFGGIPFEHFAHGGGGSFNRGPPKDADTTKLYEILGVEKSADAKEIKKAYRKLSLVHHPDRGGDEHKFKEINAAYEILSDESKREAYDKYGIDGVSDDGDAGAGGESVIDLLFGRGRSSRRSGPRKGPSVNHPIKVSLEDIYNGKTVKLAVNRKVIVGEVNTCKKCNGQGAIMEVRQIGPGMIQQMQRNCPDCSGQGSSAQTKNERNVLEVHIEKGMKDGQKVTFRGMGDEIPNTEPGDINFIVQVKEHDVFQRKGADLLMRKELSLNQALCGFSFKITHLDGRQIVVKSRPGEVIKALMDSGTGLASSPFVKIVPDEGLPSVGNPFVRGHLYIVFSVRFPNDNELSSEQVSALKTILPDPDMEVEYHADEVEEHHLSPADLKQFGKGGAHGGNDQAYDSDDEEGGRGVQCQQS
jgi:DnaJ family protein A protein 2